jgi:hypothetical protein
LDNGPKTGLRIFLLPPFDQVSGEYSKFFSESLGEMAEIGKPDLASGLLDADLAVAQ